jgi:hypothetical protein
MATRRTQFDEEESLPFRWLLAGREMNDLSHDAPLLSLKSLLLRQRHTRRVFLPFFVHRVLWFRNAALKVGNARWTGGSRQSTDEPRQLIRQPEWRLLLTGGKGANAPRLRLLERVPERTSATPNST